VGGCKRVCVSLETTPLSFAHHSPLSSSLQPLSRRCGWWRKEGELGRQVTTNHAFPQSYQMCLGTTRIAGTSKTTQGLLAWGADQDSGWMEAARSNAEDDGRGQGRALAASLPPLPRLPCPTTPSPSLFPHAPTMLFLNIFVRIDCGLSYVRPRILVYHFFRSILLKERHKKKSSCLGNWRGGEVKTGRMGENKKKNRRKKTRSRKTLTMTLESSQTIISVDYN